MGVTSLIKALCCPDRESTRRMRSILSSKAIPCSFKIANIGEFSIQKTLQKLFDPHYVE